MAQPYGEEFGKIMTYFTGLFGLPPYANLTVVETENGAPNGYAAPGMIFLRPRGIGKAAERQAAGEPDFAPVVGGDCSRRTTRNHLWLTNGFATYSELLWAEHNAGAGALETQLRDVMVEALTVDNVPMHAVRAAGGLFAGALGADRQQGRGRDEHAALHRGRREVLQDRSRTSRSRTRGNRSAPTISRRSAETVSGQDLGYFFIQWIESSGAPEFKLEYTIFRTQKGFRVMGKIAQDLDTFRMPVDLQDRDRRQPGREARRSGGHVLGILRGYLRQAEEHRDRSE